MRIKNQRSQIRNHKSEITNIKLFFVIPEYHRQKDGKNTDAGADPRVLEGMKGFRRNFLTNTPYAEVVMFFIRHFRFDLKSIYPIIIAKKHFKFKLNLPARFMRVNSLKTKSFRNLRNADITFGQEPLCAFIGVNGQGKTNVLEAIYLCALSKSFRTRVNSDLIRFDADFCSVKAAVSVEDDDKELELIVTREPAQKVMKINGVKTKSADFVATLKAVFFSPDDLSEMAFAPRLRRRYLDVLLSQLDRGYLDALLNYQEVIRHRNALLKKLKEGSAKRGELEFWDEKIAVLALDITAKRADLITSLKEDVQERYKAISGSSDIVNIIYDSEVTGIKDKEIFLEKLRKGYDRDIENGATRLGPHRDDLKFDLNDHDMAYFASRGEWRSLVLALKFAEIDLLEKRVGEKPILLLDDVFSELDDLRQKYLFTAIQNTQTFVTTTHREFLTGMEAKVFEVKDGIIN